MTLDEFKERYDSIGEILDLVDNTWGAPPEEAIGYYVHDGRSRDEYIWDIIHDWDNDWESLGSFLRDLENTDPDTCYLEDSAWGAGVDEWIDAEEIDDRTFEYIQETAYEYGVENGLLERDGHEDNNGVEDIVIPEVKDEEEEEVFLFEENEVDNLFLGNTGYIFIPRKEEVTDPDPIILADSLPF